MVLIKKKSLYATVANCQQSALVHGYMFHVDTEISDNGQVQQASCLLWCWNLMFAIVEGMGGSLDRYQDPLVPSWFILLYAPQPHPGLPHRVVYGQEIVGPMQNCPGPWQALLSAPDMPTQGYCAGLIELSNFCSLELWGMLRHI